MLLCRWIHNGDEPLRGHGDHRPDGAREGDLQPGHQVGKQHGGDVLKGKQNISLKNFSIKLNSQFPHQILITE